ncbi:MAG: ankyrin repeat domain-containing protein [Rhodospirillales bacterium]
MAASEKLMDAVKDNQWDTVRQLISAEPALASARGADGVSLLMMLAYRGQTELAALVASHVGPDVFEATVLGDTGRLGRLLADAPEAVHSLSADGWTPLHLAGFFGQVESAKLLLASGANVSACGSNYMRNTPLHAALSGAPNPSLVRPTTAPPVNATAATNITPLHIAASRGNLPAIEMLLAKGADKSAKMDSGQRPADLARERGFPAVADALDK